MGDDRCRENSGEKVDALKAASDRALGIVMVGATGAARHVRIVGHRHFNRLC
jgi:hypothetical protein